MHKLIIQSSAADAMNRIGCTLDKSLSISWMLPQNEESCLIFCGDIEDIGNLIKYAKNLILADTQIYLMESKSKSITIRSMDYVMV